MLKPQPPGPGPDPPHVSPCRVMRSIFSTASFPKAETPFPCLQKRHREGLLRPNKDCHQWGPAQSPGPRDSVALFKGPCGGPARGVQSSLLISAPTGGPCGDLTIRTTMAADALGARDRGANARPVWQRGHRHDLSPDSKQRHSCLQ